MSLENATELADDDNLPEDDSITRRGFVKIAAGGMACVYGAAVGYPIYKYLASPVEKAAAEAAVKEVDLAGADKLPAGSTMMFMFGPHPAMLTHFADGTWSALTAVCTHLGCTLHYAPPAPRIVCACHGGQYDPHTGENLAGPPPRPLTKYVVAVNPGSVRVSKA